MIFLVIGLVDGGFCLVIIFLFVCYEKKILLINEIKIDVYEENMIW